jgi:hypothetical protein
MTILNVHLEPRRALVASNTQGVYPGGAHNYAGKIFALPHASAVLAGRGQVGIWFNIFADCVAAMTDLDGMAAGLARSAQQRMAMCRAEAEREREKQMRQDEPLRLATEVSLVGWSPSRNEMVAHYCHVDNDGAVTLREMPDGIVSPWEYAWGEVPPCASRSEMVASARLQVMHSERHYPGMGWLGDLTLCEITPESITFTSVKDFWK